MKSEHAHESFLRGRGQDALARLSTSKVRTVIEPHINATNEAVHRLAGGRSLLDAALTGCSRTAFETRRTRHLRNRLGDSARIFGGVEQLLR